MKNVKASLRLKLNWFIRPVSLCIFLLYYGDRERGKVKLGSSEMALDLHWVAAFVLDGRIDRQVGQILIDLVLAPRRVRNDHPILITVQCNLHTQHSLLIPIIKRRAHKNRLLLLFIRDAHTNACRLFIVILGREDLDLPGMDAEADLIAAVNGPCF